MNKKIKIIELLQDFADEKEIVMPKYIRYWDRIEHKDEVMLVCKENIIDKLDDCKIDLNDEVEILEDNTEEIEELNAYKLMESPYMANLLKEQRYDKFMELLKQSEVEIADKLIKLTWVVKEMRKEITNVNKNNIH